MKKILCASILNIVFGSLTLVGQSNNQDISNTELFCNKPQALIEKQFIEIGFVDMIDLRLMKCSDLSTGETIYALRFEYQTTNQVISQTKLAIVDEDEIAAMTSAVIKIINNIESQKDNYTEITFRSRSGFVVGAYFDLDTKKWIRYLQMNRNDVKSTVPVSKEEFTAFSELLEKSGKQLKAK